MRRKFLSIILCVCMMMTMAPFAFAEEGGNESGAPQNRTVTSADTLKTAISNANDGDTITVSVNADSSKNIITIDEPIIITKSITLTGGSIVASSSFNGSALVRLTEDKTLTLGSITLDAKEKARVVYCNKGKLIVNGATITGGNTTDSYIGGVYMTSDSEFEMNSGRITGNKVSSRYASDDYLQYSADLWIGANAKGILPKINGGTIGNVFVNANSYSETNPGGFTMSNGNITNLYVEYDRQSGYGASFTYNGGNIANLYIGTQTGDETKITIDNPIVDTTYKGGDTSVLKPIAQVDNTTYTSLAQAITETNDGTPIKLLENIDIGKKLQINKSVVLDLNGRTITACRQAFEIRAYGGFSGGSLKVTGEGTIDANSQYGTFYLAGTDPSTLHKKSELLIDKNVNVINGKYAFWVDPAQNAKNQYTAYSYNVIVDVYGHISGEQLVYVSGNIHTETGNIPVINIHNGASFSMQAVELYLAGYAKTIIEDGATLTNPNGNVITISAGELIVNGGTFTGGNTIVKDKTGTGGAITTDSSSAIFVRQHLTRLNLKVTINGGTFTAAVPFYQATGQEDKNDKNNVPQPDKVTLSITGGYFASSRSAADGGIAIKSDDKTAATNSGFITGGYFTSDPSAYCGTKESKQLVGIPSNNSNYPFTVGTLTAANVDVAPADPQVNIDSDSIPTDVQETAQAAATAAADTSATGLDAIGGNEAKDVTETEVNNASTALSNDGVTIDTTDTVTLYIQPYLDITVTGAKVENQTTTELSLSITPMVKKVASTADTASGIELNLNKDPSKTQNATVISDEKVTNVNTPVTIKLALPTGFAEKDAKLSIKHTKENGSIEYYTGIVSTEGEGAAAKTYVTFTTNGFSPFVIYAASANVASIGDNVYPSFQAAVDAAQNGDVITLLKSGDVSATMSGSSRTITVKNGTDQAIKVTVNGDEQTLAQNATHDFTYTRPSSGSSGGSGSTAYAVNVTTATNGTVTADKKTAAKGATVTITATPAKGYVVEAVKVADKDGKDVAVTAKDGKYVFTMPGSAVTVTGSFKAETPAPSGLPFVDVKNGDWFYDAVKYAYENGLMTGTSATTFAPNGTMNRAMIVTVLYRLEKSPAVTAASKFTDVPAGQWYSDAVAWAAANNIVNGYDEMTFGPMNAVTREQMAAILFRYEQYKGLENVTLEENLNRFPDKDKISAYAVPALQWAVGQKIINGNADGTLDPTGTATRAQVAQILMNLLQ